MPSADLAFRGVHSMRNFSCCEGDLHRSFDSNLNWEKFLKYPQKQVFLLPVCTQRELWKLDSYLPGAEGA